MINDYFSSVAQNYSQFRPHYPQELFDFIKSISKNNNLAWDAGTGNGQVAHKLGEIFNKVIASDQSEDQLKYQMKHPKVNYLVFPSENSPFLNAEVDLITVGTALHWFDLQNFFKEVDRVLTVNGFFLAFRYARNRIDSKCDDFINFLIDDFFKDYWAGSQMEVYDDPKVFGHNHHFVKSPDFYIKTDWDFNHFIEYVKTWSSYTRFKQKNKIEPIIYFENDFKKIWGNLLTPKSIYWPLKSILTQKTLK